MWRDILKVVQYLVLHFLLWIVLFLFQRLVFVGMNSNMAIESDLLVLLSSFIHGLVFDVSIAAYMALIFCVVIVLLGYFVRLKRLLMVCNIVSGVLATVVMMLLPLDSYVYGQWSNHFDATSLHLLTDLSLVMASVTTMQIILMLLVALFMMMVARSMQHIFMRKFFYSIDTAELSGVKSRICLCLGALLIGCSMIIPIRGGVGIAPLNTGRAYFSQDIFANHTALNPVWNFIYSLKRLDATTVEYKFMEQEQAETIFAEMMKDGGQTTKIFSNHRPNIIVVLLESFSAHGIEYLGGENATPTIKNILKESVAFDNIMSASDRSGKGLVATMCGYPTLPTMSVIQYPMKTQSLPIISKSLRNVGYDNQAFLYGGDLRFNNFNTLVTLGGFDTIITEDDFTSEAMSDKWGAHDEYVFDRLFEIADRQKEPFFDFFFTLSSHEPFTVPMERQLKDDYLNSMCYTDKCLGDFIAKAKGTEWWKNTILVLMADHGHTGPLHVGNNDRRRYNIPLIFTGGAMSVKDTIVSTYGSQLDMVKTLLKQLDVESSEYTFSKNLLDSEVKGFGFYDFNDGFGYIDENTYEVWDNTSSTWMKQEGKETLRGKAFLQMMSTDFHNR